MLEMLAPAAGFRDGGHARGRHDGNGPQRAALRTPARFAGARKFIVAIHAVLALVLLVQATPAAANSLPTVESAVADGTRLKLVLSERLDSDSVPEATAFAVTVNGTARSVSNVFIGGWGVTLTLVSAVAAGDTVTVGYTAPTGSNANPIRDYHSGNPAPSFADQAVSNETAPPTLSSAIAVGHYLKLWFSESLDRSSVPEATAFPVNVNGTSRSVSGGMLHSSERVTLRLDSAVATGDTVTVGYVVPTGTGAKPLRDHGGNQVVAFADQPVRNLSGTPPTLSSAAIAEDTNLLQLVFNQNLNPNFVPATTAFAVTVNGAPRRVSAVSLDRKEAILTLSSNVAAGDTVTVGYTRPAAANLTPNGENSQALQNWRTSAYCCDQVSSFSGQPVTLQKSLNRAPTGAPTISGTAQVGKTLTASAADIADANGLTNATFAWQWITNDGTNDADIAGATSETYTLTSAEAGKYILVRVSFTDDAGSEETIVSAPTKLIPRPTAPTGYPKISGHAWVGRTLTASAAEIEHVDGLTNATFAWQWIANDGTDDTDIAGATASTYTLTAAEKDKTVWVRVTFTDDAGVEHWRGSRETARVTEAPSNSPWVGNPFILPREALREGETARAAIGERDADGVDLDSVTYQWLRHDWTTGASVEIPGATSGEYTPTSADVGEWLRVHVSFTDKKGYPESGTSSARGPVQAAGNTPARGSLGPLGLKVGYPSRAVWWQITDADGMTGAVFSWQWFYGSNDRREPVDIPGATSPTYTPKAADVAKRIGVRMTFTDDAGFKEVVTSGLSLVGPGDVTISGIPRVGETLTALDGGVVRYWQAKTSVTGYLTWQWIRNDGNADTEIGGATGQTYTPTAEDVGKRIKVQVTFVDDGSGVPPNVPSVGTYKLKIGAATSVVVAAGTNAPATGLPTIAGINRIGETLTASASAIADPEGLTNATFAWQWIANDGTSDSEIAGATEATYTVTAAEAGKTIKVRATFTDDGGNEETLISKPTWAVRLVENVPPTGRPTISFLDGNLGAGGTLNGSARGIGDGNGLGLVPGRGTPFTWQWVANDGSGDVDIPGATADSYTLTAAEAGKTIKVRVTFTDGGGTEETVVSEPTDVVLPPLAVSFEEVPTHHDGSSDITFKVRFNDDVIGFNVSGYRAFSVHRAHGGGKTYMRDTVRNAVITSLIRKRGGGSLYSLTLSGEWGEDSDVVVNINENSGSQCSTEGSICTSLVGGRKLAYGASVTIRGLGRPAIATASPILAPENATAVATLSATDTDTADSELAWSLVGGADEDKFTLSAAGVLAFKAAKDFKAPDDADNDGDYEIDVRVTDGANPVDASLTVRLTNVNEAPTGLPTISGALGPGETLTASASGISDADGLTNASFAWQWIANDGNSDTDIEGATDATYTLTSAEEGKTIKVRVTFTDDGGTEETLMSAATEAVASDTEAPTVAVTSDATGPVTGDFEVTVTFSEPVTGFEMSELAIVNGTASAMTGNEAGDVYTVTVTPDPGASGTLSVEVPAGVASDAAENANAASGAFGIAVRTALTASFSSVAREHDGSSVFLVPLDFSEDVVGLSYRTLKFGGIEVTGGTVRRAKRRPPGSGQGKYWTIHVKPNTDGDVTVVLPRTTDCAATGAVCTQDGRMLANESRATIPGPASVPLVSIAAGTSPVTEGTAASFTLTRRGGPAAALTVDVSVAEDGAMVDGTAPSTATFAAGSATATLTVATADDEVEESASAVTATVSSGTGYAPEPGAESAAVTVENDDGASANAKPTGLPAISGTAKVGQTLTASKTGIADADGLANATFAWQWIANDGTNDTEIAGATDATWTLTAAEEGKTVKVRATFTDDGGREETLESAATEPVAALSTDPLWTATVTVAVDGDYRGFSSMPNPDVGSVSDNRFDYGPESARRYTVQSVGANAEGVLFKVRYSGDNPLPGLYLEWAGETLPLDAARHERDGRFVWSQSWLAANAPSLGAASYVSTLPEDATVPVCLRTVGQSCPATAAEAGASNAAPTGLPTITGTARVGETLTASETGIADTDGLTGASFAWQWIANNGTDDADIADATDATYTLTAAEVGKTIKVRAAFTDDGGTEETLVSAATAEVGAALPRVSIAATSSPVTEGTAAAFTLGRTGDTTEALTVTLNVREAGAVLSGTPVTSATFAAGNAEATLSLATENDAVDEADARVTASVAAGTGYAVDPDASSAGVDVYDNDAAAAGEATVTTLWSTTLQWANQNDLLIAYASDFTSSTWSEAGDRFKVWYFAYDPWDGDLWLRMNSSESATDIPEPGELTLHIGDETVAAGDALSDFAAGRIGTVNGVRQDWEEGDRVPVRLTRTETAEAVSLPGLSVEDAQAHKADGAALSFVVTLGDAQTGAVSVRYATSDGTATAGLDYEAVSGMLRFALGETTKTVSVPVINDNHDDDGETVTLTLSQPFGATISDGTATGTIRNADPMPRAWIARFGRTVAEQVLEAVESRMRAPRAAGVAVSLGGRQVGGAAAEDGAQKAGRNLAELSGDGNDPESRLGLQGQTMTQRDFLLGSSFSLTGGTERDGAYALWGRGAVTRFDGRDGDLSLDGEVASAMLGADWSRDALMLGLVVSHSLGEGSYAGEGGNGAVSSSLTGLYPWGRYALSERLSVWGVMGYGEGTLTLTPEGEAPIDTDLDLGMAAAGLRGVLVQAPETGGLELAVKTDALGVRTSTAKADGLVAADADVTRLRLGMEGSLPSRFEDGASLVPSVELGVRRDGGDAETGFGVDIGGGLSWSDPRRGLSAELRARGLLSHEADGFRERGFSGALSWDPTPETARGLSLSMSQTVGARAAGGMDALLEGDTLAGLASDDDGDSELARRRFEMRLGYGFGVFGGRFTVTPGLGLALGDSGREAMFDWRLEGAGTEAFEVRFEGSRLEPANTDTEHRAGITLTARW